MKLTKKQIAELEARGIKPCAKLKCAVSSDEFIFTDWNELFIDSFGNIYKNVPMIVYSGYRDDKYATPIES